MTQRLSASRNIVGRNRIPVDYPEEAQCSMPLECNVFMRRGQWAINFTRATTATVTDFEWYVKPVLSGEVRFQGARRVQNRSPYSQELTNASWLKQELNVTLSSERVNGIPVYTSTDTAVNNAHYIWYNYSYIAGNKYMMSVTVKAGTLSYVQLASSNEISLEYANFDLSNGTITGGNTSQATITPVSGATGYYRISLYYTSLTTASQVTWLIMINSPTAPRLQTYVGTGKTTLATAIQMEDVTYQSVRTPWEYVSTNVLSSPFHGAFVDGVKYFNTRLDGTYIEDCGYYADTSSQNLCTQSENFTTTWATSGGLTVTPNSVASPWTTLSSTLTLSATPWVQFISFPLTVTAQRYGFSIYMKTNGHNLWQIATSAWLGSGYANFDISNGETGSSSGYIIKTKLIRDGYYRIEVTTSTLTAGSWTFALCAISSLTNGRLPSSNGTGTSGAYIWGAQIEATTPTSYMPTYGTTATRNDDILTIDLKNTLSSQGTWFADTRLDIPSTINNLNITGSSLRVFGSTWASPWVYFSNGITVTDGTNTTQTSNVFLPNAVNKVAYGFSGATMTVSLNGVNTSWTFDWTNSFTEMCLGNATTIPRALRGTIRNVQFWKNRLSDSDITILTTL